MSNRYEITSLIEKDHLGDVFLAQDVTLQRKVIFRKFRAKQKPQKKQRGKKKSQVISPDLGEYTGKLCALQHPNLLTIYDIGSNSEGYFMVTQFIEAEMLLDRLKLGPLDQFDVYNMASDLLDALHAIHSVGLVHGAMRSESIRRVAQLRGGHRYLIVDLGLDQLSAMVGGGGEKLAEVVLTAPELLAGGGRSETAPDARTDLFALGQLCYAAMIGGHPFAGNSVAECAQAYQNGGMPDLAEFAPQVQRDFADWIMSLVMKSPGQRPLNTEEAMVSLHQIQLAPYQPQVAVQPFQPAVQEVVPVACQPAAQQVPQAGPAEQSVRTAVAQQGMVAKLMGMIRK